MNLRSLPLRTILLLAMTAIGTSVAVASAMIAMRESGPPLVVTPSSLTIPDLEANSKRNLSVTLRNRSLSDVRVHQVEATCGCTVVKLTQAIIGAGETLELPIIVSAGAPGSTKRAYVTITYYVTSGAGTFSSRIPIEVATIVRSETTP